MAYSLKLASSHYAIAFLTSTDQSLLFMREIMKAGIQCNYVCLFFNWQLPISCVTSHAYSNLVVHS